MLVLADAKRGDIGSTMAAYAEHGPAIRRWRPTPSPHRRIWASGRCGRCSTPRRQRPRRVRPRRHVQPRGRLSCSVPTPTDEPLPSRLSTPLPRSTATRNRRIDRCRRRRHPLEPSRRQCAERPGPGARRRCAGRDVQKPWEVSAAPARPCFPLCRGMCCAPGRTSHRYGPRRKVPRLGRLSGVTAPFNGFRTARRTNTTSVTMAPTPSTPSRIRPVTSPRRACGR